MSSFNVTNTFHVRSSHVTSPAKPSPSVFDDCLVLAVCTDVQLSSSEAGGWRGSETTVADVPFTTPSSPTVTSLAGPGAVGAGRDVTRGTVASWTTSAPPSPSASLLFVSVGATSLALRASASGMGSAEVGTDVTSSFPPSPETFAPDVGGGGTARLAAARLGSGGAPGPVTGAGDAGLEEGANGDDTDVFPRICKEDGRPSDGDIAGTGDPARERLTAGLAGREIGGGDAGEERRERERGTGDVARAMGVDVVGVMGSGTVCGEGGGR